MTGTEPTITLWRNNRIDARFTLPLNTVADQFLASPWADKPWPIDRALAAFLTDNDGPISAVWETDTGEYTQLANLIAGRRAGRALLQQAKDAANQQVCTCGAPYLGAECQQRAHLNGPKIANQQVPPSVAFAVQFLDQVAEQTANQQVSGDPS